jgi:hypothetical protein
MTFLLPYLLQDYFLVKYLVTLACYELENGPEPGPEHLQIDFNNFP